MRGLRWGARIVTGIVYAAGVLAIGLLVAVLIDASTRGAVQAFEPPPAHWVCHAIDPDTQICHRERS